MARTARCYLFGKHGIRHLTRRMVTGLHAGEAALPEYAGTVQKFAEVVVENVNGKPQEIVLARGFYFTFDKKGGLGRTGETSKDLDAVE